MKPSQTKVYHPPPKLPKEPKVAGFSKAHGAEIKALAERRRVALLKEGLHTYSWVFKGGRVAIRCLCCGMTSNTKEDVEHNHCSFCSVFHDEPLEVRS